MKRKSKKLPPPEGAGWEHITFADVVQNVELAPRRERWRWRKRRHDGRTSLLLVKSDGSVWEFKLQGGAWMRRADEG